MVARLLLVLALLCFGEAQAGYSANGYCYASLGEAVTALAHRYNYCDTGNCRVLSYVPATATVQYIGDGVIRTEVTNPCDTVNGSLGSLVASPWYGSDPGTVSACGSVVAGAGGVTGSGGGGSSGPYVQTDAEKLADFKDGAAAGASIFATMIVVWCVMVLRRALYGL